MDMTIRDFLVAMRSSNLDVLSCPVAKAIGSFGDPWTLMILRELMLGSHRFEEFEAQLRASPALISQRLKKMSSEGVISRKQYESSPPRFEYRLTKKGLDLWPLVLGLKHWGDKWGGWPDDPPAVLVHMACGHTTGVKMVCESCGNQLTPLNVEMQMLEPMRTERATLREAKLASPLNRKNRR